MSTELNHQKQTNQAIENAADMAIRIPLESFHSGSIGSDVAKRLGFLTSIRRLVPVVVFL